MNAACRIADDYFYATFGLSGIFQTLGTYYASDGGAEIVISQITAGEAVSRAFLMGLAGGRFRRPRLREEPKNLEAAPASERPIADAAGVAPLPVGGREPRRCGRSDQTANSQDCWRKHLKTPPEGEAKPRVSKDDPAGALLGRRPSRPLRGAPAIGV